MITVDKITEIFCATDEFSKKFDEKVAKKPLLSSTGKARSRRPASMSDIRLGRLRWRLLGTPNVCFFCFGAKYLQNSSRIQKIPIKFAVVIGVDVFM